MSAVRGVTVGCVWVVSRRRTARTVKLAAECNCAPKPGPRSPPARTRASSQQPRAGLSDLHLDQDLEHVAQPSPAQPRPAQASPAQPAQPAQPSPGLSVNADQRSVELFYTLARHRTGRSTPAKYSAVSGEVSGDLRGSASTIVTMVPACRVSYTLLY